jgi:hypothetical protein
LVFDRRPNRAASTQAPFTFTKTAALQAAVFFWEERLATQPERRHSCLCDEARSASPFAQCPVPGASGVDFPIRRRAASSAAAGMPPLRRFQYGRHRFLFVPFYNFCDLLLLTAPGMKTFFAR